MQRHPNETDDGELRPLLPKLSRRLGTNLSATSASDAGRRPVLRHAGSNLSDLESQMSLETAEITHDGSMHSASKAGDRRLELVTGLLERGEFADRRINRESLARGRQKLLDALAGRLEPRDVDEDLPNLMIYKGRPLFSATVLHLAVWCSAHLREASLVDLILKCDHEIQSKAKYELPSRKDGWTCELHLDALHIACGFGSLPAVEALVLHYMEVNRTSSPLGSTPATHVHAATATSRSAITKDYVNLFTVKKDTEIRNGSRSRTENFYQPIHEAADKGFVDVMVYLLECGAEGGSPNLDGVYPLHLVALRGSAGGICTGDHVGLRRVVQLLQDAGGSLETQINRKHYNAKWAGRTPLQLAASDDSRFPRCMMGLLVPCLQDNSINEPRFFADIAFLTTLDMEAATDVVREIQNRAAKNNTVLQRFRVDAQKEGRTDLMASILFLAPEAAGMMMDMLIGDPLVQDPAKHNIPTRTSLYGFWKHLPMRCIYRDDAERRDDVLLPSWAFETDKPLEKQDKIAWHGWLVPGTTGLAMRTDYVYTVSVSTVLMPNALDLDLFQALARTARKDMKVFSKLSVQGMIYALWNNFVDYMWIAEMVFKCIELFTLMWWSLAWPLVGPRGAITADKPFCWAMVTAGAMKDAVQMFFAVNMCCTKYYGHADATMRSMWHPMGGWSSKWFAPRVAMIWIQVWFSISCRNHLAWEELSQTDQVLLAALVLMKSTYVVFMFRLCAGGAKIYAIFHSFLGGATREMISITAMIFVSFSLAFLVLAKDKAAGWVLASSYRGLLFGDGDGFNNLGMNVNEASYPENNETLMIFLVIGSFFFNIILLNLIIAVYGNEYDKVAGETPLLFLHGRAHACVMFIASFHMFPWLGSEFNTTLKLAAVMMATAAMMYHSGRSGTTYEPLTAMLLAAAQLLWQAALAQCDWFSTEGIAANKNKHFLWICHRDRAGETLNEALQVGHFEERLDDLRKHVDGSIGALNQKLDAVIDMLAQLQ